MKSIREAGGGRELNDRLPTVWYIKKSGTGRQIQFGQF